MANLLNSQVVIPQNAESLAFLKTLVMQKIPEELQISQEKNKRHFIIRSKSHNINSSKLCGQLHKIQEKYDWMSATLKEIL